MTSLGPFPLPAGDSCAVFPVRDLAAPLGVHFDAASTAMVYLDGCYLGAVILLASGGAVFEAEGRTLVVYRVGDAPARVRVLGRDEARWKGKPARERYAGPGPFSPLVPPEVACALCGDPMAVICGEGYCTCTERN